MAKAKKVAIDPLITAEIAPEIAPALVLDGASASSPGPDIEVFGGTDDGSDGGD